MPGGASVPAWETAIEAGPRGQTRTRVRPRGRHVRRPPTRTERERKFAGRTAVGNFIRWGLNGITEGADFVGVLWDSLPPELRRKFNWKDTTILDRIAYIWEHADQIRPGHAIANFIANQLEDKAFGRLGRLSAKANQSMYENYGIDLRNRLPKAYLSESPMVADPVMDGLNKYLEEIL